MQLRTFRTPSVIGNIRFMDKGKQTQRLVSGIAEFPYRNRGKPQVTAVILRWHDGLSWSVILSVIILFPFKSLQIVDRFLQPSATFASRSLCHAQTLFLLSPLFKIKKAVQFFAWVSRRSDIYTAVDGHLVN